MKNLGREIGNKMKDGNGINHIQWLDVTMNDFDQDAATVNALIQGIKKQTKIIYVGLTTTGTQAD